MVDRLVNSEANEKRISHVQACFGGSGQMLLAPGRVLVGEGVLTKLCRKKPKPRQFFLFNDLLVYGSIVMNKKKYSTQHILPLEDVRLKSVEDDGNLRNGWQIISATKSFTVYAATATEKSEWMAHINKCISDLLAKSGKKPATELSPVWVPDSEAPLCMLCKKSKFTALNRRHHCRKCGKVVCGQCSAKKFLLPQQSVKPQRVCNDCYEQLSSGQMSAQGKRQGNSLNYGHEDDSSGDESTDEDEDETPGDMAPVEDEHPTFYEGNYK
ncbi:pleckstrin homology domain-containing family F member 2-like isoform X2 [Acanthaster planci]|uniref:Pleckstrin homology domain-containing family F member 2-like isoform X2 n=1 Tax=Acanthaster planci TaxID=133434 RepID=A0A8B7YT55_ACAPL|nr:pleckstrin homology domain-containing family F member 2-like isoform X2 [Acanthaster planci]